MTQTETDIHPITPEKRAAILAALADIEREHDVRVVFACESGSRGWGFSSPDSDYDVRFIYVHRAEWYLTVNERIRLGAPQRDVIELPIDAELDVSGWDLRKALRLLSKCNPTLSEWLRSPIVYREDGEIVGGLRELAQSNYSRLAAWHHYHSMAKTTYRSHLGGDRVRTKKYLYALRPILACLWIEKSDQPPPMAFEALLDQLLPEGEVRDAIDALLVVKRASGEVADGPRIPAISGFIETQLERMGRETARLPARETEEGPLDVFFRQAIGFSTR